MEDYADYDDFYPDEYDTDLQDHYQVLDEDNFSPVDEKMSMSDIYEQCVEPTLFSVSDQLGFVFLSCLLFKVVTQIFTGAKFLSHLTSFVCGVIGLFSLIGKNALYTIILSISAYWLLIFCKRRMLKENTYFAVMIFLFAYLIFREYFIILPEFWEQVRGVQMIIVLKVLSLCFEVTSTHVDEKKSIPTPIEYLGYIFFPGTIIFGPWIPFSLYKRLFDRRKWMFSWVLKVFATSTLAFLCLGISSCWIYWLFLRISTPLTLTFRDALSVRFSHYFVALMSESMCLLCGFYSSEDTSMNIEVTKPQKIEFPRSLVEVVVYWNRPMHQWLKIHIFRQASRYGHFLGIFLTFLSSSILHGLNFGLSMVLLSLGIYTYIEYQLRRKLANIFDACIGSRSCLPECQHTYKSNHWAVFIVNLMFTLLAYFHLAYLGSMMDRRVSKEDEPENQDIFEIISQQLKRWSSLNYISHWIIVLTYMVYAVI